MRGCDPVEGEAGDKVMVRIVCRPGAGEQLRMRGSAWRGNLCYAERNKKSPAWFWRGLRF